MRNFTYARAESRRDAIESIAAGAAVIAGGTEFLNWMRLGIADASAVVDIGYLDDLSRISMEGNAIRIGALATLNEIEGSALVRANANALAEACLRAASAQLRNRATIGGNILQKTRCPYFRAEAATTARMPWPCNKRVPGSGCAALEGHYDRAALFGWTETCVANQPSDPAVALAALDAIVEIEGPDGARAIPMVDFHLTQADAATLVRSREGAAIHGGPLPDTAGAEALLENRLRPGEIITGYRVPVDVASKRSAYLKLRERESYEYAMVSAAVCLERDGETIGQARIALGSVAQKPWRLTQAEAAIAGATFEDAALNPILDQVMAKARALPEQEFKITLARNAARRAIQIAGGRTDD